MNNASIHPPRSAPNRRTSGSVLVGILMALLLVGMIVPALVLRIQKESKDTVREKRKTTALQLAEAGQDRGAWKLRESGQVWLDALDGIVPSGYDGISEFTDVAGGRYKIHISSGPAPDEVTVVSKGRATDAEEVRAIEAVYSKSAYPVSALSVNSALTWKPNLRVHWGPVLTYGSIEASPGGLLFPRKFSAGQIVGRDVVNDADNGAMPGDEWDVYDYVAFYDLGVPPTIDLEYYRTQAKAMTGIEPMKNAVQDPLGSGYFTPTTSQGLTIERTSNPKDYILDCPTCVLFVEGAVNKFPNGAELQVKALVVMGDMDFNADDLNLTVDVPCEASLEYQHSGLGTYFSDNWTDCDPANLTGVGMQGFLYVGEDMENAGGGATLHGALFLVGDIKVNTFTIYYDDAIAQSIETAGTGQLYRTSWDEIVTNW